MSNQQQIQQQREAFTRTRAQLQQAQSRLPQITQMQLRQQKSPLMGRIQRQQIQQQQQMITQQQQELEQQQSAFEREVAIKAPEYADPEIRAQLVEQARQKLQNEAQTLEKEYRKTGDKKVLKELRLYQNVLAGKSSELGASDTQLIQLAQTGKLSKISKRPEFTTITTEGVIIDGLGYSVAPELQQKFIESKATVRLPTAREYLESTYKGREMSVAPTVKPYVEGIWTRLAKQTEESFGAIDIGLQRLGVSKPVRTFTVETKALGDVKGIPVYAPVSVRVSAVPESLSLQKFQPIPQITPKAKAISEATQVSITKPSDLKYKKVLKTDVSLGKAVSIGTWAIPVVGTTRAVIEGASIGERILTKQKVTTPEYIFAGALALGGIGRGISKLSKIGKTKEIIKPVAGATVEQVVVYPPKLKAKLLKATGESIKVSEESVGLVFQKVDTGLIKQTFKGKKLIKQEPIKQYLIGTTKQEQGLFKTLPRRQAEVLEKTISQKAFGREFATSFLKGKQTIGGRIKASSFVSGTKIGKQITGKGLAKVKLTKPRIQRTGKLTGTFIEVSKGAIGKKKIPFRVFKGFTTFKSLYKAEPLGIAKVTTKVIGQPQKAKDIFSIKLIEQQIQQTGGASFIQAVYGKAPQIITKVTTPKVFGKSKPIIKSAGATVSVKSTTKPIPREWQGVYDVQTPIETTIFQPQRVTAIRVGQLGLTTQRTQTRQISRLKQGQQIQQKVLPETSVLTKSSLKSDILLKQRLKTQLDLKQDLMELQQQKTKELLKTKTTTKPTIPKPIPTRFPTTTTPTDIEEGQILVKGFDVYIRRNGKWIKISRKALARAEALKLGAERVERTLSASFKIVETPQKVATKRKEFFQPSPNIFRSYKIVKGKKIALADTFIQRRGKRLSARSEVAEIQRSKKQRWI